MDKLIGKGLNKKPVLFLDQLLYRFSKNNVVGSGTQLTYFLILSIFPFIIVLLNVLSYTTLSRQDIISDMIQYLPYDVQLIIEGFVNDVVSSSSQSLLSIAAFAGLWTASSGVKAIIRAINLAYDYAESRSFLKLKGLSLVFTFALLLLIMLVLFTLVLGELLGTIIFEYFGRGDFFLKLWNYIRFIIPMLYMILIFTLLYRFSPNVRIRKITFRETLPGAIFTSLGWSGLSILFSYYVNNFGSYALTYGSLGGVIVLLVWLYISSIVIVLGGEINATISDLKKNDNKVNVDKSVLYKMKK